MRHPLRYAAALVLACLAAFICPMQPASAATKDTAPADAYFGKMKMSYLGINNSFRDAYIMAGDHTTFPVVIQKIQWAENAFLDWQKQYPHDPQLARSLFLMSAAYLKVWTADGQTRALYYIEELRDKFGTTYFGKLVKADLAKGLTVHVFAAAQPCTALPGDPPATPDPVPTADPAHHISVDMVPAPCFTPPPTPSPAPIAPAGTASPRPSPSATPTPSASPGR